MKKHLKTVLVIVIIVCILTVSGLVYHEYVTSQTNEAKCFLSANGFLKDIPDNSVIFTDSSTIVYYYTKKENHYYTNKFDDMINLMKNYYTDRPIYILWTKYDNSTDFRENLNNNTEFETVYRCPDDGNLAIIYKLK